MKKIIIWTLLLCILSSSAGITAFGKDMPGNEYLPKVYIDSPLPSAQVLHAVFSEVNGDDYMFTTSSGTPAVLNVYNLDKNELVAVHKLPGTKNIWFHLINTDGNLYICSKGYFFRYNPYTDELKQYGFVCDSSLSDTFVFDNDEDGNIYIGCCGSGNILKYNIATDDFTDFGMVYPNTVYVRSISYCNGYIYAGIKGDDFVKLVRVNRNDPSDKEELPLPENPDYYDLSKIQWIYDSNVMGDKVILYVKEVAVSPMIVYDTVKEEFIDIGFTGSYKGLYSSPEKNGKSYFISKGYMYALDDKTGKVENLDFKVETTDTTHAIGWITMENNPDHTGDILVTVNTNNGQPIYYDLTKKERFTLPQIPLLGSAFMIQSIAAGDYKNGDDAIYLASYLGESAARYNLKTRKFEGFNTHQVEGMLGFNGKMYLGTYTKANFHEYDYTKPMKERLVHKGRIETHQDRPFALTGGDNGKVYAGTIPDYGYLGGALAEYNPETGKLTSYENIIENQSIIGLAYKDGLVYGSTSVWGGLSATPTEKSAKIFIFDPEKGEVIKEFVPKIKGVSNPLWIGGLAFDKNGTLWAATGSTLFSLNAHTEEVTNVISFGEYTYSTTTHQWRPLYIRFDKNGLLYVNINSIQIVDVDTLETRSLMENIGEKVHLYDLDKEGNIFYSSNSQFWMLPVNNADYNPDEDNAKIKALSEEMLILVPDISFLLSGGQIKAADIENTSVAPFIRDGRCLVPIRVISEELGAEVLWNGEKETASISLNGINAEIKIGERSITVNGEKKETDCAAEIIEGRTFVPLRAAGEILGKNVEWYEDGIISVSDSGKKLTPSETEKIKLFFDVYVTPLYAEETNKKEAVEEYYKLVESYGGEQIKFTNWNLEEKIISNGITGFVKSNDFAPGCSAKVTGTRSFIGNQSLNIKDISTVSATGYSTTLIPYSYSDDYAVIVPLFLSSGRTTVEIAYYDVDGKYLGRDVHNEEPGHNIWNIMNYKVPKLFKGAKYLRVRCYTSEYWLSDAYYDEITVIKYKEVAKDEN